MAAGSLPQTRKLMRQPLVLSPRRALLPVPVPLSVVNGVLFNVSWLAIVYTHSAGAALSVAAIHLALHFALMGRGYGEGLLVAGVTIFGVVLDQLLFYGGVFTVDGARALAPVWMTCLWPVLATTFMHAFEFLQRRPVLAAAFGAVGGAGSYVAGTGMSDVAFASAMWGPVLLGVLWAGLLPLLLWGARRLAERYDA